MPTITIPLTLLGLVPFIACGLLAVGHYPQSAELALVGLIDYAALMLSFAGGVHWGLALMPGTSRPSVRIAAGALPMLVAWAAVVIAQMIAPTVALCLLILGYLATVLAEHRAAQRFLIPSNYVWLRWAFTGVAVVMMVMVLVLRGLGQTIVL
jgi:Protein of unknown function (DUF3429)